MPEWPERTDEPHQQLHQTTSLLFLATIKTAAWEERMMKLMRHIRTLPPLSTTTDLIKKAWGNYRFHPLTIISGLIALFALFYFTPILYNAYSVRNPQTCTQFLENQDYTKFISLQKTQQLEAIQFINQITGGQPTILIQVMDTTTQRDSGVYVYGCKIQDNILMLTRLLGTHELSQGVATLTTKNTLSIGELDTSLSAGKVSSLLPLQENIYQEYTWKNGNLQRVSFPGLYPVLSRSEAEALQKEANNGTAEPWNDPIATARQMAQDLLQWTEHTTTASIIHSTDSQAEILLTEAHPLSRIIVTLQRLLQNNAQGIWFVTDVHSQPDQLILKSLQRSSATSMQLQIQEQPDNPHAQITATLFDHTLTPLTTSTSTRSDQSNATYQKSLVLPTNLIDQPGLLLLRGRINNKQQKADQIQLSHIDLP